MRTILILCIFLLVAVPGAVSQESSGAKVGIGVGIEPFRLVTPSGGVYPLGVTPVAISVPIQLSGGTRIEPEIGLYRHSSEVGTSKDKSSFFRLGAGVFFPVKTSGQTIVYIGPKVGVFLSSTQTTTDEMSETDFFVALNIGGDYAISNAFHVFGEAQIYYVDFGNPKYVPAPPTTSDRSESMFFSNVVMGMRFYF